MKEHIKKYWWVIIVVLIIGYLVYEEVESNKKATIFCKEQCEYLPNEKQWGLDLRAAFKENGILEWESSMELVKFFPEKDLDECVKYCVKAGDYLSDLLLRNL